MPRREDLKSVLVIGSGPIVIGQGCEFDYSGTQACRVLEPKGIRVSLVNSNPATIMTDPEFADATYVEPITPDVLAKVIAKERPDALLPTLGGQTALNAAVALHASGTLKKYSVELIGADIDAIEACEDREKFKEIVTGLGAEVPRSQICRTLDECFAADSGPRPARRRPAVLHPRRPRLRHRVQRGRPAKDRRRGPGRQPHDRGPPRGVDHRLEGVRARADARPQRQRGDRLLDRERRPDGRAHRRLGDGRPRDDAHRPRVPAHARHRDPDHPRGRRGHRRLQHPVRRRSEDRPDGRHRDEPARRAGARALASKATGFPIAKIATRLAIGYTLDEIPNDITGQTPASFEPALDYVVVKIPRFAFEKFPGADTTLTTHMKSVGEAMAIGRSFGEALQKAQRSLESHDGPVPIQQRQKPTPTCCSTAAAPRTTAGSTPCCRRCGPAPPRRRWRRSPASIRGSWTRLFKSTRYPER